MLSLDGIEFTTFGDFPGSHLVNRGKTFDGYYGIQYNHSGKMVFSVDDGPEELFDGPCLIFTAPNRSYNYNNYRNEPRHHCYLCFRGPRVDLFIREGLFAPYAERPVHRIVKPEPFYRTMLEIQALLLHPPGYREKRKVLLLEDLLLQIQEQEPLPEKINVYCEQMLQKLREEIVAAPQDEWNFEQEAKRMSVSYSHFRRIIRMLTGYAPTQFLIECRLNHAMKLLTNTALSIREIAHESGFEDEYYFSRIFRKHRQLTPSAYRKEFRI